MGTSHICNSFAERKAQQPRPSPRERERLPLVKNNLALELLPTGFSGLVITEE